MHQARQMNRLQNNPEKIDKELQTTAQQLTQEQAQFLGQTAKDSLHNQNERAVAIDLLTRQPQKNQAVLLDFLSRTDFPEHLHMGQGGHHNQAEMFEYALSLQVLRSLEKDLITDKVLRERLFRVAKSSVPKATKEHLLKSLVSSSEGHLYWNEVARSLSEGHSL